MFDYRFFYIGGRILVNRKLIWVIYRSKKQNVMKVTCFAELENWYFMEGTLCRFHTTHPLILFDLWSVLITYIFGNNLIKASFQASVISSNWKWKTMLFFSGSFGFMFKQCHSTLISQLSLKTDWYRVGLFLRWR